MEINLNRSTLHKKKNIICFAMTMPTLLIIIVFLIVPMFQSFYYSFTNWDGISRAYKYIGLENYNYVVSQKSFIPVLKNTFYLMILYVPVLNVLALLLALLVFNTSQRTGNFFKSLIFLPNLLPLAVVGFVWKLMYNYSNGLINKMLRFIKLDFLANDWLGQQNTVIPCTSVSVIWYAVGYFMVIYIAGLTSVPVEMYEAGAIEGTTPMQKFLYITLPMIAPSITINVVLSSMNIFVNFGLPFVLTGGGPGYMSETLALNVYHYAFDNSQQGPALALAVFLGILAIIIALVELLLLVKREEALRQ